MVFMANKGGATFKEPAVPAMVVTASPDATAATAAAAAPAATEAPAAAAPAVAAPAAAAPAEPVKTAAIDGAKIYTANCAACHASGVANAPKFGDKAAWAPRIKQGAPVLYEHAIKGFAGKVGMMPPKGGSSATDDEVKAAVDHMTAAAK